MASAIEMYQQAYDLDYRQGDWESAEELYTTIVERFPHSDEKEYAQVHLERIQRLKGNPKDPELQPVRSGGSGGLAVFSFFLVLLLIVGTGYLGYFSWQQHKRIRSQDLVLQGLMSIQTGNGNLAQRNFELAKEEDPDNAVAYQCLAELFLKHNDLQRAQTEHNAWALVSPGSFNLKDFSQRLQNKLSSQK